MSFLGVSLVSVKKRDAYPMFIEQIVRDDTSSEPTPSAPKQQVCDNTELKRPRGRPKGSKNRNKDDVVLTGILKQLQTIVLSIRQQIEDLIPLRYLVLDGYFGHNNALQIDEDDNNWPDYHSSDSGFQSHHLPDYDLRDGDWYEVGGYTRLVVTSRKGSDSWELYTDSITFEW